ncbi:MAG: hypothetical protein EBX54_06125 [Betaproteobacteria bacterium]|nr:hypothetical protein [Betaproteobacteria bacterium]
MADDRGPGFATPARVVLDDDAPAAAGIFRVELEEVAGEGEAGHVLEVEPHRLRAPQPTMIKLLASPTCVMPLTLDPARPALM